MTPSSSGTPAEPIHAPISKIVAWGTLCWGVILAATLLIPALHEGDRSWWPWCAAAGAALGLFGWAYLRRGRGNAADT